MNISGLCPISALKSWLRFENFRNAFLSGVAGHVQFYLINFAHLLAPGKPI